MHKTETPLPLYIVGRFPPPLDGQTLSTRRLAELLADTYDVHRINTQPPGEHYVAVDVRLRPQRIMHYLCLRSGIRRALAAHPGAPVLWGSISPVPLGHWRDVLTTIPALHPDQPVVAILHRGTFERLFLSNATRSSAQRLVQRVSRFVFLNATLAAQCAEWIPEEKRVVIPNTVASDLICSDLEIQQKRPGRSIHLLFCSNMMVEKGYLDVLDAVKLLQQRQVPFTIDFAGRWAAEADRIAFEKNVNNHGLQDTIRLHGPISDPARLKQLYLQADVFLLPSFHPTEAQPLTVLEALNAGVPVVVTRHGGLPEIVSQRCEGILVRPHAPAEIASAIEEISAHEQWGGYSERARLRFKMQYSPESVREKWIQLVQQITRAEA